MPRTETTPRPPDKLRKPGMRLFAKHRHRPAGRSGKAVCSFCRKGRCPIAFSGSPFLLQKSPFSAEGAFLSFLRFLFFRPVRAHGSDLYGMRRNCLSTVTGTQSFSDLYGTRRNCLSTVTGTQNFSDRNSVRRNCLSTIAGTQHFSDLWCARAVSGQSGTQRVSSTVSAPARAALRK